MPSAAEVTRKEKLEAVGWWEEVEEPVGAIMRTRGHPVSNPQGGHRVRAAERQGDWQSRPLWNKPLFSRKLFVSGWSRGEAGVAVRKEGPG